MLVFGGVSYLQFQIFHYEHHEAFSRRMKLCGLESRRVSQWKKILKKTSQVEPVGIGMAGICKIPIGLARFHVTVYLWKWFCGLKLGTVPWLPNFPESVKRNWINWTPEFFWDTSCLWPAFVCEDLSPQKCLQCFKYRLLKTHRCPSLLTKPIPR